MTDDERIEQIRAWERGDLYPDHDTFSFGHGFGTALVERFDRLVAERDAAHEVAASSFRDAFTSQVYDNGQPAGSLAELAHVEVDGDTANWRIQYGIADELRRWLVPPSHRPTCPSGKPCTSWSCLLDVCVLSQRQATVTDEGDGS